MYPADTSDVHLIRTKANGEKSVIHVDVSRILAGQASDIPVQSNDVIDVPYSNVKIGPYVLYSVVSKVGYGFGWGMSIP